MTLKKYLVSCLDVKNRWSHIFFLPSPFHFLPLPQSSTTDSLHPDRMPFQRLFLYTRDSGSVVSMLLVLSSPLLMYFPRRLIFSHLCFFHELHPTSLPPSFLTDLLFLTFFFLLFIYTNLFIMFPAHRFPFPSRVSSSSSFRFSFTKFLYTSSLDLHKQTCHT